MRNLLLAILTGGMLLMAPVAQAAPTCQDRRGDTVRCATGGAMPVGWTLPAVQRPQTVAPPEAMLGLGLFLFGFFALLALLPDFDGRWDSQEGDRDEAD